MVAALEREVSHALRSCLVAIRESQGRVFKFYESEECVLVCGGIGAEAARRAAEALVAFYSPQILQSVGFAGALEAGLKVGDILLPQRVIDARDNSAALIESGAGVLITFSSVASVAQKAKLAAAYGAQAVDMEAAAVARVAQIHGIRFAAIKVISDEVDFEMPGGNFISERGEFLTGRFLLGVGWRPWLWPRVARLARNSSRAARALGVELGRSDRRGVASN